MKILIDGILTTVRERYNPDPLVRFSMNTINETGRPVSEHNFKIYPPDIKGEIKTNGHVYNFNPTKEN